MNAIEIAKKHPYMVGGATLVIVVGAIYLFGSSGSAAATDGAMSLTQFAPPQDPNAVAAATQAQLANIAAQAHTADTASAEKISLATIAAGLTAKEYEKQTSFHVADLAATQARIDSANRVNANTQAIRKANVDAYYARLERNKLLSKTIQEAAKTHIETIRNQRLALFATQEAARQKERDRQTALHLARYDLAKVQTVVTGKVVNP